ncbi:MAG: hypothetical protein PHW56_07995, partial [Methanosarcinaceae archaeon]|nr:hypothetical protein [Methanosarcinaceae archaeon]
VTFPELHFQSYISRVTFPELHFQSYISRVLLRDLNIFFIDKRGLEISVCYVSPGTSKWD